MNPNNICTCGRCRHWVFGVNTPGPFRRQTGSEYYSRFTEPLSRENPFKMRYVSWNAPSFTLIYEITSLLRAGFDHEVFGARVGGMLTELEQAVRDSAPLLSRDFGLSDGLPERYARRVSVLRDELNDLLIIVSNYAPHTLNYFEKINRVQTILGELTAIADDLLHGGVKREHPTQVEDADQQPDPATVFHTLHQMLTTRQVASCAFYHEIRQDNSPLTVHEVAAFTKHAVATQLETSDWQTFIKQMHDDPFYLRNPKGISDMMFHLNNQVRRIIQGAGLLK